MRNYILLFLLFASFVFGQETNSLVLKILENQALMKSDMNEGFKELLVLEKIAQKEKNIKANLEVLNNKAFYYFTQADYDKAYQIAKSLEKESNNINDKRLIAIAMNRLGITLNFLELYFCPIVNPKAKKIALTSSFSKISSIGFARQFIILPLIGSKP